MRARTILVLLGLVLAACGDDDGAAGPDSGPLPPTPPVDSGRPDMSMSEDSGPPEDCNAPLRECPEDAPMAGIPCEGTFTCPYEYPAGVGVEWTFSCRDGRLEEMLLCGGCAPLPSESCREPFAGSLSDGAVEVGPVGPGPFRAFESGERIRPEFGGQGAAMLFYRIRIDGEELPTCVSVTATVSLDGMAAPPGTLPVKLRCGQSLRVFSIYPSLPCEFRDYPVHLDLDVEGVGTTSLDLVLEGGMCPRGGFDGSDGGVADGG